MKCNLNKKQEREGMRKQNTFGEWMTLETYHDALHVDVLFDNGERVTVRWKTFETGGVRNPYTPSVFGIGYLGKDDCPRTANGKADRVYMMWTHMMQRAYSENLKNRAPTYRDCEVAPEWLNYSTFYKDVLRMCPKVYDKTAQYELDKDLICKGNKTYGPKTCCFLPGELNTMLTQANAIRGDLPVGVVFENHHGKPCYRAQISRLGTGQPLWRKRFKTPEEAFNWYAEHKKAYLLERAEYWKDYLSPEAYAALLRWEVDRGD